MRAYPTAIAALVAASFSSSCSQTTQANPNSPNRVQVTFSGGHDTDNRDGGRPVVLIAAALGVPEEVFREAFSHVHPADPGRGPTGDEARANKRALMQALAPYGVTNERLDEVSNYYRYNRSRGEMWPTTDAVAYALVKNGKITGFDITTPGSGYSSLPLVSIPGFQTVPSVTLAGSKDFEANGSVARITLPDSKTR
ncbi:hypothetical protein IAD21_01331 [Abditibacteriota bacterium]|nr:hypothetical protein IAD21_01331 [Abditibacteriota bacterium]